MNNNEFPSSVAVLDTPETACDPTAVSDVSICRLLTCLTVCLISSFS